MRKSLVAACAALLALAAACSSSAHPAPKAKAGSTHTQLRPARAPQLSPAQARQVFAAFLPRLNYLLRTHDAALVPQLTTGAEQQVLAFQEQPAAVALDMAERPVGRLTRVKVYVPRLSTYPRWFWAVGRPRGDTGHSVLYVMVQSSRAAPWKAAMEINDFTAKFDLLGTLRAIVEDSGGYATEFPRDLYPSLIVAPAALPGLYAKVLNLSRDSTSLHSFHRGPNTTGYISYDRDIKANSVRYGWRTTDTQAASGLPVYALVTTGEAAFVVFVTNDVLTWQATSSSAALPEAGTFAERRGYTPAHSFVAYADVMAIHRGLRVTVRSSCQCFAIVPTQHNGRIDVVFYHGGATSVTKG